MRRRVSREGIARDLIRIVQVTRKDAGLAVSDRIRLALELPATFRAAAEEHAALIRGETLATELVFEAGGAYVGNHEVQGEAVKVGVAKAA